MRMTALVFVLTFALTGCEGSHDLARLDCLPLKVPTQVVLVQEAGLYDARSQRTRILSAHPRDTVNDAFNGFVLRKTFPPGTRLQIDRLDQHWGFDVGRGRISAFGTTPDGDAFEYGWGGGTQIGRAPWEPSTTTNLREVACDP